MQDTERSETIDEEKHFKRCLWFETGSHTYGQAGHQQTANTQDEGTQKNGGREKANVLKEEKVATSGKTNAEYCRINFMPKYFFL